jgi:hypothetical protein
MCACLAEDGGGVGAALAVEVAVVGVVHGRLLLPVRVARLFVIS